MCDNNSGSIGTVSKFWLGSLKVRFVKNNSTDIKFLQNSTSLTTNSLIVKEQPADEFFVFSPLVR